MFFIAYAIGTQMTQIEQIYTDFFILIAIEIVIYSSLILYFLMLIAIKSTVIPINIKVSFQMVCMVAPLSMMALMIMMNHLAGMMLLMICKGNGILEMGNIKPDRIITGSINPAKENIMAVCCDWAMVEIKIPSDSAVMMNNILSKANRKRLPSIGISKTKTPKSKMIVALIMDKKIYGNTFPMTT